jgi:hypothetical protein
MYSGGVLELVSVERLPIQTMMSLVALHAETSMMLSQADPLSEQPSYVDGWVILGFDWLPHWRGVSAALMKG